MGGRTLAAAAATTMMLGVSAAPAAAQCPPDPGGTCGPGNNRQTRGGAGTGNVPHDGWPKISGILWKVTENSGNRTMIGGPLNDELLGHHGNEVIEGRGGHDVLWGDWNPRNNTTRQRDVLRGGPGNDWLYPSHGRTTALGGPGNDHFWAFYGKGTIDCGPGRDEARVRANRAFRVKNCEKVRFFCAHGSAPDGRCKTPTGNPTGPRPGNTG